MTLRGPGKGLDPPGQGDDSGPGHIGGPGMIGGLKVGLFLGIEGQGSARGVVVLVLAGDLFFFFDGAFRLAANIGDHAGGDPYNRASGAGHKYTVMAKTHGNASNDRY